MNEGEEQARRIDRRAGRANGRTSRSNGPRSMRPPNELGRREDKKEEEGAEGPADSSQ